MPLEWIEATIDTAHESLDIVCARLSAMGIEQLCIEDEIEFRCLLEKKKPSWELVDPELEAQIDGVCRVTFYLPDGSEDILHGVRGMLSSLPNSCPGVDAGPLTIQIRSVREEDWAENWKKHFRPIPVGKRLLVQPAWEAPIPAGGRTVFLNDPGVSFGTGEHETTRMCLEQVDRLVTGGERVLDVGCGSGILSICALLLGADKADAVDIDPQAVAATLRNAQTNGLDAVSYRAHVGDLRDPPAAGHAWLGTYQLILVNIVADTIVALLPILSERLAPGGRIILSGIIESKSKTVLRAFSDIGLCLEDEKIINNWCCYVARKRSRTSLSQI
ncbi:MAG: 50S ribosomal protein L11 methyltransferase [Oscillospiraceae bacterium]|nr:50S ribosomal protein L11 methyltransferase [Oscillospiraceae bacterium]